MTETKLTGKKDGKLSKKGQNQKVTEDSKGNFAEGKITGIELHWDIRTTTYGTSPWHRNIVVGSQYNCLNSSSNGSKRNYGFPLDRWTTPEWIKRS